MRFTPEHGHAILNGQKTTHRTPAGPQAPPRRRSAGELPANLRPRPHDHGDTLPLSFPHVELRLYTAGGWIR